MDTHAFEDYFVCYRLGEQWHDGVVSLPVTLPPQAIPNALRQRIYPDKQGDREDGLRPQRSADCVIVNFFKLK